MVAAPLPAPDSDDLCENAVMVVVVVSAHSQTWVGSRQPGASLKHPYGHDARYTAGTGRKRRALATPLHLLRSTVLCPLVGISLIGAENRIDDSFFVVEIPPARSLPPIAAAAQGPP